jgi:hypothetical protein
VGTQSAAGDLILQGAPALIGPKMSALAEVAPASLAPSATDTFQTCEASCLGGRVAPSSSSSLDRITSLMTSGNVAWVHQKERCYHLKHCDRKLSSELHPVGFVTTEWSRNLDVPFSRSAVCQTLA